MLKLFFALAVFNVFSCTDKETEEVVSFDLDTTPVPLFATGIVEDYEIVPLETTPDAVIGRIDKVILTENRIYIYWIGMTPSRSIFSIITGNT